MYLDEERDFGLNSSGALEWKTLKNRENTEV